MNHQLQIGIIGTGWFAKRHADALAAWDGVRVKAVCGSSIEKATAMATQYGANAYASTQDMVERETLDAVYVCVPPFAHGEIERTLITHKIPFFLEKPLGTEDTDTDATLRLIQQTGLITSVGYHFRYYESSSCAKSLLAGRRIGMAAGQWYGSMPGVYWWRAMNLSGGQFMEQTTHIVDLVRYLLGDVREVYAKYGCRVMHEKADDVTAPDVGTVILTMQSGAIVTIANACVLPSDHSVGLQIFTDQGTLEMTRESLIDRCPSQTIIYTNHKDPYMAEHEAFLTAVRTGDTTGILSTYADAAKTHAVTRAANTSAEIGQPICL